MIAAVFTAGALTLDSMAVGQFMFSRPVVVGTAVGAVSGNVLLGLAAGAIIELLWVTVIPVGKAIPPDGTAAAALTVYWSCQLGGFPALGLALAAAVPFGILFKKGDFFMRRRFAGWNNWILARVESGKSPALCAAIAACISLVFLKSVCFYLILMPLGVWMLRPAANPAVFSILPAHWLAVTAGVLGCSAVYESLS